MDRIEVTGVGVALVGHAALLAALTFGLTMAANPPAMPDAMEVSFVEEVGLAAAAPEPATEPAAAARALVMGPAEDAAPTPAPAPPEPRAAVAPQPRQTAPGTRGAAPQTRRRALDIDLDGVSDGPGRVRGPPAAAMSAAAAADIGSAIVRQVQPCADRQVDPGPGASRIVTPISLRLNRDGSLATRPRVGQQRGLDDENRRYAQRVADLAVNAFVSCAPLRGLPQELYDVPRGWSNFTLNYRLPG